MRVQIAFFCIFAIISTTLAERSLAESQEVDREKDKKGTIYTLIKILWSIPPSFWISLSGSREFHPLSKSFETKKTLHNCLKNPNFLRGVFLEKLDFSYHFFSSEDLSISCES